MQTGSVHFVHCVFYARHIIPLLAEGASCEDIQKQRRNLMRLCNVLVIYNESGGYFFGVGLGAGAVLPGPTGDICGGLGSLPGG